MQALSAGENRGNPAFVWVQNFAVSGKVPEKQGIPQEMGGVRGEDNEGAVREGKLSLNSLLRYIIIIKPESFVAGDR